MVLNKFMCTLSYPISYTGREHLREGNEYSAIDLPDPVEFWVHCDWLGKDSNPSHM